MNYDLYNRREDLMKSERIITKLLVLWLLLSLYVTLHEGGHGLAVLLYGGKINFFNINLFNARISYTGDFTMFQKSIIHLAGFSLPYLLWFLFISLVPVKTSKLVIKYIKVYSVAVMFTIIPWIIIPLLHLFGKAPAGDDTTKFLISSGLNGLVVSLVFLCVLLFSFYIWRKKTKNIIKTILLEDTSSILSKNTFRGIITLAILFLILMSFPWINQTMEPQVREDYQLLCQTPNLRELGKGEWELCKFWVEDNTKPKKIEILIIGKNVSAKMFDLKLEGSNNTIIPFTNSKEFNSGTIKYKKETALEAGEYRFMMNADEIEGYLYIYLKRD